MEYILINSDLTCGGITGTEPNHNNWTLTPYLGGFVKEQWNGLTWVEGATEAEIAEYQKSLVPTVITRRQFKIALAILGKNEQNIIEGINQLPEPSRTIALISYSEAGTFERYNSELIFVGKNFLQMTDEEIDNVFIRGNQY